MSLDFNHLNEGFEYESPQSLLYKFYRQEAARCPACGTTYRYFLQNGKFGCAKCYDTFASQLKKEVLPRMQRSHRYVGRKYGVPCRFPMDKAEDESVSVPREVHEAVSESNSSEAVLKEVREDLQSLQKQLKEAVIREDYEQAARLRDEIRKYQADLQEGGKS